MSSASPNYSSQLPLAKERDSYLSCIRTSQVSPMDLLDADFLYFYHGLLHEDDPLFVDIDISSNNSID